MKALTKISLVVPAMAVALLPVSSAFATSAANLTAVDNGVAYLNTQQTASGSIPGPFGDVSAWAAIAYESAGRDISTVKTSGGTSLLDYLKANPPASGASATDLERDILAITSAGQDPYSFGSTNYVAMLEALHTGGQVGDPTLVNDDIFGVLALVSANVPTSDTALTDALKTVTDNQRGDGSFSWSTDPTNDSDVDDTASALMALQAAKSAGLTVNTSVITDAMAFMLSKQNQDGGFLSDPNYGTGSNVSTTSWALMALNSFGEGDGTAGTNAQAYLRAAQQQDGSFPYTAPGAGDTGDTASAVNALTGGFWPLHIYAGALPGANSGSSGQSGASPSPSSSPSPTASPSPSPSPSGAVLGASTTSANDPSGAVLGASTSSAVASSGSGGGTLPSTGSAAGLADTAIAIGISLFGATLVYLRARRSKQHV